MGAAGAAALAGTLRAGSGLARLVLGPGNELDDAAVEGLAAALCGASGGGDGGEAHGGAAAAAAPAPRGLQLDLSDADVGAPGVHALAAAPQLQRLSLFGSVLSDPGVDALVDALGPAPAGGAPGFATLRELNIAGCHLGLAALMRFVRALEAAPEGARPLQLVEVRGRMGG
jgi:hypothetical protein